MPEYTLPFVCPKSDTDFQPFHETFLCFVYNSQINVAELITVTTQQRTEKNDLLRVKSLKNGNNSVW